MVSWTYICRAMSFVVLWLLFFLGPPVAQGKVGLWPLLNSSSASSSSSSQPAELLWQKQQSVLHRQAVRAHLLALDFLNRKHNTTYYRAPGMETHVMIEMAFGRAYHVNTVLVNASCPEGYADVNPTDCKVAPDSKRLECHLVVVLLFGNEHPYINEEGCQEFKGPPGAPNPSSSDLAREEEPEEEREALP